MVKWSTHTNYTLLFPCNCNKKHNTKASKTPIYEDKGAQTRVRVRRALMMGKARRRVSMMDMARGRVSMMGKARSRAI